MTDFHPLACAYANDPLQHATLGLAGAGYPSIELLDSVIRAFELVHGNEPTHEELVEQLKEARYHGY